MRPALRWAVAALPYAALAPLLRGTPDPLRGFAPMEPLGAAANGLLVAGALCAHSLCYARWHRNDPARITANELLTRLWFVGYGLLVVGGAGGAWDLYATLALGWAAATFLAHLALGSRLGGYPAAANYGLLGAFLIGSVLLQRLALGTP